MSTNIDPQPLRAAVAEVERLDAIIQTGELALLRLTQDLASLQPAFDAASAALHRARGLHLTGEASAESVEAAKAAMTAADLPFVAIQEQVRPLRSRLDELQSAKAAAFTTALDARATLGLALFDRERPKLRAIWNEAFKAHRTALLLLEPAGGHRHSSLNQLGGDGEGLPAMLRNAGITETWGMRAEGRTDRELSAKSMLALADAAIAEDALPATDPAQPATPTKRGK